MNELLYVYTISAFIYVIGLFIKVIFLDEDLYPNLNCRDERDIFIFYFIGFLLPGVNIATAILYLYMTWLDLKEDEVE